MDELERFVKELASENVRLVRENTELRQKSTDYEVENAKLRTQLERGGAQQWVAAKAESAVRTTDCDVKPNALLSRPVGVAARVSEAAGRLEDEKPEAKRARTVVAENSRTTSGVSDGVQRNAAAACAGTLQQYSFAHLAQALFSVLFVSLLAAFRSLLGLATSSCAPKAATSKALGRSLLRWLAARAAWQIARSVALCAHTRMPAVCTELCVPHRAHNRRRLPTSTRWTSPIRVS